MWLRLLTYFTNTKYIKDLKFTLFIDGDIGLSHMDMRDSQVYCWYRWQIYSMSSRFCTTALPEVCVCVCVCVRAHVCVYKSTCVCVCKCVCMHKTCVYLCMCVDIHMHCVCKKPTLFFMWPKFTRVIPNPHYWYLDNLLVITTYIKESIKPSNKLSKRYMIQAPSWLEPRTVDNPTEANTVIMIYLSTTAFF